VTVILRVTPYLMANEHLASGGRGFTLSANVTLNGKRLDGKVVPLRPGFLASEVKGYLDQHKDGFDSYKVSVGGRDFLVLGQGYKDLKASDNLAIDGQRAQAGSDCDSDSQCESGRCRDTSFGSECA